MPGCWKKVWPFSRDIAHASAQGHLAFQDRGTTPAGQGMATAWLWVWNVAHRAPAQTWDWKSYGSTTVGSSTAFRAHRLGSEEDDVRQR